MNDDEKDRQFREVERKSDWAQGILAQDRDKTRQHYEDVQP